MRRVAVSTLLALAIVLTLTAWGEAPPSVKATDGGVAVPRGPALALDPPLRTKAEILTGGRIEQRTIKSRPSLGLAVLVGLSALLLLVVAGLHRLWPGQGPTLSRRSTVTLRAPPVLRLS
ncbi:MAG: hypothetical protein M3133_05230 [Actinomycetota bacterium]|nr:hypothetical protein [Actinomycetota bacterium]